MWVRAAITNWLTDYWNCWSDGLLTYSVHCATEGSSSIGIPQISCQEVMALLPAHKHIDINAVNLDCDNIGERECRL